MLKWNREKGLKEGDRERGAEREVNTKEATDRGRSGGCMGVNTNLTVTEI